jgi:hypothetical protein
MPIDTLVSAVQPSRTRRIGVTTKNARKTKPRP